MLNNLQIQIVHQIAFEKSAIDAVEKYYFFQDKLKGITIIKSSDEEGAVNLYEPFEKIENIEQNLYTPFGNGKIYFFSERTFKTLSLSGVTITFEQRCISFDTQTISYLERYYKGQEKEIPSNIKNVLELMKLRQIGVDNIPYVMENLLLSDKNEENVKETLNSFEELFYNGKRPIRNKIYVMKTLRNFRRMRKKFECKRVYYLLYLILMKMSYIQLRHNKKTVEEKMDMMCRYMKEELGTILIAELILAKKYFEKGQSFNFFGKIQKGRKDLSEMLKNMAWDLHHLRFLEYGCVKTTNLFADFFVPYFYTYDKRLLEAKECYKLEALVIDKQTRSHYPIYAHEDEIKPFVQKLGVSNNREIRLPLSEKEVEALITKEEELLSGLV